MKKGFFSLLLFFSLAVDAKIIVGFTAVDNPYDNGTRIDLQWQSDSETDDRYTLKIERAVSGEEVYTMIGKLAASAKQLSDTGLEAGREYIYRYSGYDGTKIIESGSSDPVRPLFDFDLTDLEVGEALDQDGNKITLKWHWEIRSGLLLPLTMGIERRKLADDDFVRIATIDPGQGHFFDTGVTAGESYNYRLVLTVLPDQSVGTYLTTSVTSLKNFKFSGFSAVDRENDSGGAIKISWKFEALQDVPNYSIVLVRTDISAKIAKTIEGIDPTKGLYEDTDVIDGLGYSYKVVVGNKDNPGEIYLEQQSESIISRSNPFKWERLNSLILFVLFCSVIMFFIGRSRKGKELFIRRIAGLSAIEDAIGRATEMGKKILYIPGIMSMDDVQTIASMSILNYVARYAANYDTLLEVPNKDPITFAAARETVKEAFMAEGKPDKYREDMVSYITYDQFAYTASVCGKMVRERPAANFLIGSFYAESLLLAETGQLAGSIQIAGTAEVHQLPFFVCACDYTLIGEELYAASAYISKDPLMVGSIKGQDWVKMFLIVLLLIGVLLETFGFDQLTNFLETK